MEIIDHMIIGIVVLMVVPETIVLGVSIYVTGLEIWNENEIRKRNTN